MSELQALQEAVKIVGGQTALAEKIGKKQGHIWHWLNESKKAPAEAVLAIEAATDGKVSRHQLRPDIYPPPVAPTEKASAA